MKILKCFIFSFLFVFGSCNSTNNTKNNNLSNKINKSLVLVFNSNNQIDFWQEYKSAFFETSVLLYKSGKINFVLPFAHKPLKHPNKKGTWTNCILIGLNSDREHISTAKKIIKLIQNSGILLSLKSADLMRLQDGLDMLYSINEGIREEDKLEQILEYVFSKPKARTKYYEEQHLFSGPAMSELHNKNMAGRFIGYELERRLFGKDFPEWDLIHIVGFTKEQTEKATPIFLKTFDKHAEKAFGKGMTFHKKLKEWDQIRINIKSDAKQNMKMTLKLAEDERF